MQQMLRLLGPRAVKRNVVLVYDGREVMPVNRNDLTTLTGVRAVEVFFCLNAPPDPSDGWSQ
jgi:hypothetical protein